MSYVILSVCDQAFDFKNIERGKSVKGIYEVKCEGSYTVYVEFQSGKRLRRDMGYVSSGLDLNDTIEVTASDIDVKSNFKPKSDL